MNKSASDDTLEEVYLSNSSLLSESTNFSDDALSGKIISIGEPTSTTKRGNRLVTALRSFRKKKTDRKSLDGHTQTTETTEDLPESQRKSVKIEKKRSRASRLVKRLSMSGIRRSKKSTDNLKRETPEGATLSVSEISLIEIGVDENNRPASKTPRKGDQLQITISGKKIEKRVDSFVEPTSDTKIPDTEPSKPQRKSKKFDITVSDQDTSPTVQAPPIPYSICGSDISISSISTVEKISHTHSIEKSSICSTGVIKKSSFRKQKNRPVSMSVNKTGSMERGRRYPRPADDVKSELTTGTSLESPSASASSHLPTGTEPPSEPLQSDNKTDDKPKIQFEVGTKVRPLSTPNLHRISETSVTYSNRDELSSLDTSKCSECSSESKSDTSRRRIAYVAAPSISFSEDEPADSLLSREPLSHLSGISEYNSLDSDFSLPPLFGNVVDDDYDDGVGGILKCFLIRILNFFRFYFSLVFLV